MFAICSFRTVGTGLFGQYGLWGVRFRTAFGRRWQ